MARKKAVMVSGPTARRYDKSQEEQAVRLVRLVRAERIADGRDVRGVALEVAGQLGCGAETVRRWVREADRRDGLTVGAVTEVEADELKVKVRELEGQVRELTRANTILRQASAFFAAELDRPHR